MTEDGSAHMGVVVIGRNEGERLVRCLASLPANVPVVYVDSGSTDDSVMNARARGVTAIGLDRSRPFTAARGRNAGFLELQARTPELQYVQFIDGDCEVRPGFLDEARAFLAARPDVIAVFGRRRERFPERSVYNRICDIEWDVPVGEAYAFGGDVMIRAAALLDVGLYDERLIAGEDPNLSIRLKERGGRIWRIDAEMTLHDADIRTFSQWWRRTVRAGHAYAEGQATHGGAPLHHWDKEVRSNWVWGVGVPSLALMALPMTLGASVLVGGGMYAALFHRIDRRLRAAGTPASEARAYALLTTLAKFPQAIGQAKYWISRAQRRPSTLIEYKR